MNTKLKLYHEVSNLADPSFSNATIQNNSLKVLQVISSISPQNGGPTVIVNNIIKSLENYPTQVDLATSSPLITQEKNKCYAFTTIPNIPYQIAPGFHQWIKTSIRNYDVVHIHGVFSFFSTVAGYFAKINHIPYIVTPHGLINKYGLNSNKLVKRLSFHFADRPILRSANIIHFLCKEELQLSEIEGLKDKCVIIPPGINSPKPSTVLKSSSNIECSSQNLCGFIGRIDPVKNIENLFKAISHLSSNGLIVNLIIAGTGLDSYVKNLKRLAEILNISQQIIWRGHISSEEKDYFYSICDFVCIPSWSESFSLSAIEAVIAGKLIFISKNAGVAKELSNLDAAIIIDTNYQDIACKIELFIRQNKIMPQRNLQKIKDQYSLDSFGSNLNGLYTKLKKVALPGALKADEHS